LLLLDTWQRSGLSAGDFADLIGLCKHTLFAWKRRFDLEGPAGLLDKPKGAPAGSKLPDLTKRTILMLKAANPDWGCQRISDMLARGPALPASLMLVLIALTVLYVVVAELAKKYFYTRLINARFLGLRKA